jgi:hypothetical protein
MYFPSSRKLPEVIRSEFLYGGIATLSAERSGGISGSASQIVH